MNLDQFNSINNARLQYQSLIKPFVSEIEKDAKNLIDNLITQYKQIYSSRNDFKLLNDRWFFFVDKITINDCFENKTIMIQFWNKNHNGQNDVLKYEISLEKLMDGNERERIVQEWKQNEIEELEKIAQFEQNRRELKIKEIQARIEMLKLKKCHYIV